MILCFEIYLLNEKMGMNNCKDCASSQVKIGVLILQASDILRNFIGMCNGCQIYFYDNFILLGYKQMEFIWYFLYNNASS
jgi:phosphoribosylformylglycinamidine (FGAM) synthase-like amidotransferase family enzyme